MNQLAHVLDSAVYSLQPFIIGIAVLVWAIALVAQFRSMRENWKSLLPRSISRTFMICFLIFAGVIGAEFTFSAYIKHVALNEIRPVLDGKIESISINGRPFDQIDIFLPDLRALRDTLGHHSHPTQSYDVLLRGQQSSVKLLLMRDSSDRHEYWVYSPLFSSTQHNDIGRVFTSALDRF